MTQLSCIVDVDTGFDDALALLLALQSPDLNVLGITCVVGNQRLAQVVTNTLKIVELAEREDIPIAAGMSLPLIEALRTPMALHGHDGMADLDLPDPTIRAVEKHAVELMRMKISAADDPVEIVALGPLTNVAVFVRMYPKLLERLSGITIMGGTFVDTGNTSPVAEFNFRHDPEAASIVLQCGVAIRLYPLDVFRHVTLDRWQIDELAQSPAQTLATAGKILQHSYRYFQSDRALIGDAGAVATMIRPDLCEVQPATVTIELAGQITRGQLVVDRRTPRDGQRLHEWWAAKCVTIDVITDVDVDRCCKFFIETVGTKSNTGGSL